MSYAAGAGLQAAVYQHLRGDAALAALIGDAVFDAMPVQAPGGVHVALGPEVMRDAGDATAAGSEHDLTVSVLAGQEDGRGFAAVKTAAAAVSDALEGAPLVLERGQLVGIYLLRAKARRVENGAARRVDLTFRARIDLG